MNELEVLQILDNQPFLLAVIFVFIIWGLPKLLEWKGMRIDENAEIREELKQLLGRYKANAQKAREEANQLKQELVKIRAELRDVRAELEKYKQQT